MALWRSLAGGAVFLWGRWARSYTESVWFLPLSPMEMWYETRIMQGPKPLFVWLNVRFSVERVTRIELVTKAWEAAVIPFHHTRRRLER